MPINNVTHAYENYVKYPDQRTMYGSQLFAALIGHLKELETRIQPQTQASVPPPLLQPVVFSITMPELPEEEYLTLLDFLEEYRITVDGKKKIMFSDGGMLNALHMDENLVKICGKQDERERGRWYVKPLRFIHYMSQCKSFPKLRKRCIQWLQEQEVKNGNNTKVLCLRESLQARDGT